MPAWRSLVQWALLDAEPSGFCLAAGRFRIPATGSAAAVTAVSQHGRHQQRQAAHQQQLPAVTAGSVTTVVSRLAAEASTVGKRTAAEGEPGKHRSKGAGWPCHVHTPASKSLLRVCIVGGCLPYRQRALWGGAAPCSAFHASPVLTSSHGIVNRSVMTSSGCLSKPGICFSDAALTPEDEESSAGWRGARGRGRGRGRGGRGRVERPAMRPAGEVLGSTLSVADILAWDKADTDERWGSKRVSV